MPRLRRAADGATVKHRNFYELEFRRATDLKLDPDLAPLGESDQYRSLIASVQ